MRNSNLKQSFIIPVSLSIQLIIATIFFSNSLLNAGGYTSSMKSFYDLQLNDINGDEIDLQSFKGKKVLLVNVASKCGYTDQYADLQELYETHGDKLEIIGIPCNDFGRQEPGSANEIQKFCKLNYGVTFTLAEKQKIKSERKTPSEVSPCRQMLPSMRAHPLGDI